MKFGRLLRTTAEDLPEMESLFLSYKQLKKQLKRLPIKEQLAPGSEPAPAATQAQEDAFVAALGGVLQQMNDIFLEKEETSVIRVEALGSELAAVHNVDQLDQLHKRFIDFHGETLLLVHWSILAYTATVKILKKHHKRTGLLLRAPQMGDLLSQPFCSTELMSDIAMRVDEDIRQLSQRMGIVHHAGIGASGPGATPPMPHGGVGPLSGTAAGAAQPAASSSALSHAGMGAGGGVDLQLLQRLADDTDSDSDTTERERCSGSGFLATTGGGAGDSPRAGKRAHGDSSSPQREGGDAKRGRPAGAAAAAGAEGGGASDADLGCDASGGQAAAAPAVEALQAEQLAAQQAEQQQVAAPAACCEAVAEDAACGPECGGMYCAARRGSILRQTQVALTTWAYLKTNASTPSTLIAEPGTRRAHAACSPVHTQNSEV